MVGYGMNDGRGFPRLDFTKLFEQRKADRDALNTMSNEKQMQSQLDRLELICMALWSLVKEKTNLSEEDLAKRIQEIDLAEGMEQSVSICPQCKRPLSLRHHRCLYCGYTPPAGDFTAFQQPEPASEK